MSVRIQCIKCSTNSTFTRANTTTNKNNTTKIEPKRHIECIKVSLLSPRKPTSKSRHRPWGKLATLTIIETPIIRIAKAELR